MRVAETILYQLSKRWPAPKRALKASGLLIGEDYHLEYAMRMQFQACVRNGVKADIRDKEILEIGCGHGGITCFLALNGARRVVGIDLNTHNLGIAEKFHRQIALQVLGSAEKRLNLEFQEKDATALDFPDASFDIVWAENVFEHFMEPEAVMQEAYRVLRHGGQLYVPVFSSIYSKHGAHLKQGLKLPWSNLLFSEKTICKVLARLAQDNPIVLDMYPGLAGKPQKIRDLRRYKDLNDITFKKFKRMAIAAGFEVESFSSAASSDIRLLNRLIRRLPIVRDTMLHDIFSTGAAAVLRKKR